MGEVEEFRKRMGGESTPETEFEPDPRAENALRRALSGAEKNLKSYLSRKKLFEMEETVDHRDARAHIESVYARTREDLVAAAQEAKQRIDEQVREDLSELRKIRTAAMTEAGLDPEGNRPPE